MPLFDTNCVTKYHFGVEKWRRFAYTLFWKQKPKDVKRGVRMLSLYLSMLESGEDKAKCTQLYEKYHGLLIHVAYAKLKDEHLAEDAAHNAFLNIVRNFHLVGDIDSHKTKRLLVVVTENAAIDMLRKNKHYAPVSYDELENVLSMDKDMLDNVAVQELVELICELPEIYRDVLELRAYHGLSEKQIAAILDVEYATVRKRLERARTMLAEKMKQQEGEVYEHL